MAAATPAAVPDAAVGRTPAVSIRIAPADLARARAQAARRGLRYQTYVKMLLHEALDREEKVGAPGDSRG